MAAGIDKDCIALGDLFQTIISDMRSQSVWQRAVKQANPNMMRNWKTNADRSILVERKLNHNFTLSHAQLLGYMGDPHSDHD